MIQAFTTEEEEARQFAASSTDSLRANLRMYMMQTFYSGAINVIIAFGTALVLWVGASKVLDGTLTIGQVLVFIDEADQATGKREGGDGDDGGGERSIHGSRGSSVRDETKASAAGRNRLRRTETPHHRPERWPELSRLVEPAGTSRSPS